jgi:hypothetical protein
MTPPAWPTELFAEACFAQRAMIGASKLRETAINRGIDLPLAA